MTKKRNRFHNRPFTDPYKKSAAVVTVYGGNKRSARCCQDRSSVYFRVMAVTSSPGDISEWPAALAPLSLSSDPLFINNTSTTPHRSLGREKVADNARGDACINLTNSHNMGLLNNTANACCNGIRKPFWTQKGSIRLEMQTHFV